MGRKLIKRWKLWSSVSTNRKIFSASIVIAICTIVVKLVALFKEQLVAASFGTGADLDVFIIAFLVPSFFISVITGALNAAFIPTYIRVRELRGNAEAQDLLTRVVGLALMMLLAASVIIYTTADSYLPYVAHNFNAEQIVLAKNIMLIVLPGVAFSGINIIWGAVLNANERFAVAAIIPIITPALVLMFLLITAKSIGVMAIACGTVFGMVLESIVLGVVLLRHGFSLRIRIPRLDEDERQIGKQLLPMISGSLILGSSTIIDQSMATMLTSGSVAALNYGNRLIAFPLNIAVTALGTAVVPYFSIMLAQNDFAGIRHTIRRYFILLLSVSIPAAIGIILLSEPIVRLVFQRGAFGAADTAIVSQVLACFALQLPFYITGILVVRLISALLQNKILFYGNIISVILNISLNYIFMQRMGVAGIALSTSLVYLVSFCFLSICCWRYLKTYEGTTTHAI